MFARMTKKGKLGMLIAFALVICVVVCSYAEVLMPEATGKKVQKDGKLLVDSSNCSEGYIMVRTKKDNKRMKLRITMGGRSLNYDINSDGEYENRKIPAHVENRAQQRPCRGEGRLVFRSHNVLRLAQG